MFVVVLNDSRTWTDAAGCALVEVPDDYIGEDPLRDGRIVVRVETGGLARSVSIVVGHVTGDPPSAFPPSQTR